MLKAGEREKIGIKFSKIGMLKVATFFGGLVVGLINCDQIALLTLTTGPFIIFLDKELVHSLLLLEEYPIYFFTY